MTNVKLPGMLHGRVVHPGTLGSHLVEAGKLDKTKFPNTQLIVKGDLVAVVAPTEWEAVLASWQVAGATKWTEWKGLPGQGQGLRLSSQRVGLEGGAGCEGPPE